MENGKLIIHTSVRGAGQSAGQPAGEEKPEQRIRWSKKENADRTGRLTFGERLIRNAAVACALLLTVMAVRNLHEPWSDRLTAGVRSAITMRVDWDHTLGRLSFVRALVPETALVFLNLGEDSLGRPAEGPVRHAWSEEQPWLEISSAEGGQVWAAEAGTVSTVGQGASGDWIVLVSHEAGESVYGYLKEAAVKPGQAVARGECLGRSGERLYFEWREEDKSVDPSGRMGL